MLVLEFVRQPIILGISQSPHGEIPSKLNFPSLERVEVNHLMNFKRNDVIQLRVMFLDEFFESCWRESLSCLFRDFLDMGFKLAILYP